MADLVIIESPFAGKSTWIWPFSILGRWLDQRRNVRYARAATRDSLMRGESPLASHLLYTQPGILNDNIPTERTMGIYAGFDWGKHAVRRAFYVDLGVSTGMTFGRHAAEKIGQTIEYRRIPEGEMKRPSPISR